MLWQMQRHVRGLQEKYYKTHYYMEIIESLSKRIKDEINRTTISLREYIGLLHNEGSFVIPDYQRG